MLRLFVLLVLSIFFNGCFGEKDIKSENSVLKYPNWFTTPPQDSERFIYSVGEGMNEREASLSALNRVASKISIEVESTYQSKTVFDGDEVSKNQSIDMKQSVKKIEFNNYSIVRSEKLGDKSILLLKVDRVETAQNLKRVLKNELNTLEATLRAKESSQIQKIGSYERVKKELLDIGKRASLIKTINSNLDDRDIFSRIKDSREKANNYLSQVEFRVLNGGEYGEIIKKIVGELGYKISNSSNSITIFLNLKKSTVSIMGNSVIKVSIQLETRENRKVVSKDNLMVGGKSRSGFNVAEEFAVVEFENRLRDEKIIQKLIGLD